MRENLKKAKMEHLTTYPVVLGGTSMPISDAASLVEFQTVRIKLARSVLSETIDYFEREDEWQYLPFYAERILNLLFVTDDLLYNTLRKLTASANAMHEKNGKEENHAGE